MTDIRSTTLDRLEARIDYQASRIDALYALLEERGLLPCPADADGSAGALFDELVQIEDAPMAREKQVRPSRRSQTRLRVGSATGV
jgi:hypothetical protein